MLLEMLAHRSAILRPLYLGLLIVAVLGGVYPLFADVTQQPLAVFVLPVLVTAALGSGRESALVGIAAFAVAVVEAAFTDLGSGALAARLFIIGSAVLVGTLVAFERGRRQAVIEDGQARMLMSELFQISLAPVPVPPAGIDARVRFVPGDDRLQLGGDFIDAIRLPTGHLGYVIGDVCGHGPRAAAFGAAVRSGWKTLATEIPDDPVRWVYGLEAAFFRLGRHTDTFVTLNTGILETGGRFCYVSAGHPWPVLLHDQPTTLTPNVGPPLGVGAASRWTRSDNVLPTGATLLLYTDGLIENSAVGVRRDNAGEQRLISYLRSAGSAFDVDALLAHFGPTGFDDDVAILALRVGH